MEMDKRYSKEKLKLCFGLQTDKKNKKQGKPRITWWCWAEGKIGAYLTGMRQMAQRGLT